MSQASYLNDLATHTGFSVLPKATTFKTDYERGKGIVLGLRDGYLIALGLASQGRQTTLKVLIRFRKGSPREAIESTLKSLDSFRSFTGRKNLKVQDDSLVVSWPYVFKKPAAEAVLAFVNEVVVTLKGLALPIFGKCEDCNASEVDEVTLVNGIPGYHCESCRNRFVVEKQRAAEEYKDRQANYVLGVPAGVLAAAATGTAWGLLISGMEAGSNSWTPKLHAIAAFGVGAATAWVLIKTTGKVTRIAQAIAILLTLLGKFWGDSLFFTFDLLIGRNAHVSMNPLAWSMRDYHVFAAYLNFVVRHFWEIKLDGAGKIVLGGDLLCAFCIPWLPWAKMPKFVSTFESAGRISEKTPVSATSQAGITSAKATSGS